MAILQIINSYFYNNTGYYVGMDEDSFVFKVATKISNNSIFSYKLVIKLLVMVVPLHLIGVIYSC